jgi:hypothetical protein
MKMHVLWRCNRKHLDSYSETALFEFRSVDLSSYLMFALVTNADRGLRLRQNSFFPVLVQFDFHIQHGTRRCKPLQQFSNLSFQRGDPEIIFHNPSNCCL